MQKTLYFWGIALLFLAGTAVASALVIFGVLPNTADDANLEYIELYNDSCAAIDLRGVSLRDASKKTYTFAEGILESGAHRKVMRTESKITLNNTSETVEILDAGGNVLHQIEYVTSFKDIPIEWEVQTPNCQVETTIEETTVETVPPETVPIEPESPPVEPLPETPVPPVPPVPAQTGATLTGAISETQTGAIADTSTGATVGSSTGSGSETASGAVAGSSSGSSLENIGGTSTGSDTAVPPSLTGSVSLGEWITVELGDGTGTVATSSGANLTESGSDFTQSWADISGSGSSPATWDVADASQSGAVLSGSGASPIDASSTGSTGSWATLPDMTIPIPLGLFLYDTDDNGKIDRLAVTYSGMLSGALQTEKFIIYSASGGLADHQIETSSGVVRHMEYSGSTLLIELIEQNLAHTALKISNTTASDLRLKTLSGFGLTSLSGVPVLPLTFTQSFDGYDGKYIHNAAAPPPSPSTSSAGGASPSVATASSSSSATSGSSPTPTWISPIRVLPDPTIVFQSGVTAQWSCKTANCPVNVVHVVQEKFEMCRWQMTPAWGTAQTLDGCNPRAVALGGSGGTVGLTLLDSAGILPFKTRSFQISPFVELPKTAAGSQSKAEKSPPASQKPATQKSAKSKKTDVTVASDISNLKAPAPKPAANKVPKKITLTKAPAKPKAPSTKTTTVKKTTTTSKAPAAPKAPADKVAPIAPAYQKPQSPSDSVALGIIGIACAGIGFCISLFRRKEPEPTG